MAFLVDGEIDELRFESQVLWNGMNEPWHLMFEFVDTKRLDYWGERMIS